jgi:hypothetical protein
MTSSIFFKTNQNLSKTVEPRKTAINNDAVQGDLKQFHIMRLSSADDKRQRDSTSVDENASLAPIFFPDQLDCVRLFLEQEELCSYHRQCSATAKLCPPFRHSQQDLSSKAFRKNPPLAIQENTDELRLGYQNLFLIRLSIVYQSAKRKQ